MVQANRSNIKAPSQRRLYHITPATRVYEHSRTAGPKWVCKTHPMLNYTALCIARMSIYSTVPNTSNSVYTLTTSHSSLLFLFIMYIA
jgi:hypothetical protein